MNQATPGRPLNRPATSLSGRAGAALSRRFAREPINPATARGAVTPLGTLEALELLCAQLGKPASRSHLTAALPVADGELAPRFIPHALSRVGLEAHWEERLLANLRLEDLPVLAPLHAGGAILVLGLAMDGSVVIRDGAGEHTLPLAAVQLLLTGEVLHSGHLDPENGASEVRDRALIRRNPRLWLLGAYLGERAAIGRMVLAATLLNLCAFTIPLYMRAIYDRVVPNLAIESLWALSAGVVIVLVFELLLKKLKSAFIDRIGVRVGQAVQHRAIASVLRAREHSSRHSVGSMMTALRDVEQLSLLVPQAIVTLCVDLPWVIIAFALIAAIGGLTVLGPILGGGLLLLVGMVANYALKLASKRASKLMHARSELIAEVAEGWTTIKANQAEGLFQGKWDVLSDHMAIGQKDVRHWNELPAAASGLLVQLVTVMVVIVGVLQIKAGAMTTGALIAVVMLTSRAMVPVSTTIGTFARLYQSLSQFKALANILQAEPERHLSDPAIRPEPIKGGIRASALSYRFTGSGEATLRDIDLAIRPGEKIALIGKCGSGKSTLLQVLAGLLPNQDGVLTVDGHAIDRFAVPNLRSDIVYAAHDATIFDMTLWQNILLGLPEPDGAVVDRAIRCSGLDAFIARTVEGYMRKAGARGSALSGGQRQALLLARALVRDPAVLLLDEPTASLDVSSEQAVIAGLREACADKTLVIATHRLALLDLVDRVIWLDGGKIVADRPKAEVLAMLSRENGKRAAQEAA